MATTISTVYLSGCNYQIKYDLVSQSTANNTSTVKLYGVLNVTNNYVSWSSGKAQVWNTTSNLSTYYSKGSYTVAQETITVTHNTDGTKSITVTGSLNTTYTSGSTSGKITLPKILRQATITSASDFNDEQNPTMKYSNPAGNSVTALRGRIELPDNTILVGNRDLNKTGTSYTFNLTEAERNTLRSATPNSNTLSLKYVIETVIGSSTFWSVVYKTMTIVNGNPTFSNFDFAEQETTSLTGSVSRFIKGYSDVKLTISNANKATAKKSATIKSYQTTIGTKTKKVEGTLTYPVNYNLYDVDSATIDTWAIDSRGNSTKVRKTATLINYNPISYSTFTLTRASNTGTTTTLKFNGKIDLVNFGSVTNQIKSIKYYYKRYGEADSTYVQGATTLNPTVDSSGNISINQSIQGDISGGGFNQSNQYTIKIEIVDELLNVYNKKFTATTTLGSGSPAIAVKGNNIAIGRNYDESAGGRVQIPTDVKTYINGSWKGIFSGNYFNNDLINQSIFAWKSLGSKTGSSKVTLPSSFNELLCVIKLGGFATGFVNVLIPYNILTTNEQGFSGGYYGDGAYMSGRGQINATKTQAWLGRGYINNSDVLSSSTTYFYYR